jgi:hypothetical protein
MHSSASLLATFFVIFIGLALAGHVERRKSVQVVAAARKTRQTAAQSAG